MEVSCRYTGTEKSFEKIVKTHFALSPSAFLDLGISLLPLLRSLQLVDDRLYLDLVYWRRERMVEREGIRFTDFSTFRVFRKNFVFGASEGL